LKAFYSHYDQKNAGQAGRDLQVLFAGYAATELEKALVVKDGCNLSTDGCNLISFAEMKSATAVGSAQGMTNNLQVDRDVATVTFITISLFTCAF
jgi:hypothetical protein